MKYDNCKLYGLKRKKELFYLLDIDKKIIKLDSINSYIKPRIDLDSNMKPKRLIEVCNKRIKVINKLLYYHLSKIETPNWHFSKKGSSYLENALYHQENRYILLLDISKFFPNTSRETVYSFFNKVLKTSPDIANILTNLSTVDLDKCDIDEDLKSQIDEFVEQKEIWKRNHLISGASTSSFLSFLVHYEMFQKIKLLLGDEYKISVYVDDITISSKKPFDYVGLITRIEKILSSYGHKLSMHKVKYIDKNSYKKITGVMIGPACEVTIPNCKQFEIIMLLEEYKKSGYSDENVRKRLKGLVNYARYVDHSAFPRIYELVK